MVDMAQYAARRSIISGVEGIPNTFSSWDNCMSKTYCKWPVIAAIIFGSLIALSIVWCLARCLCCGMSCCCSCLKCIDCFTPNRHGRNRDSGAHKDEYRPMNQGFQPMPSPMVYNQPPQFATFDASTKIHEDSLPAMPSWETAQKRRVENPDAPKPYGEDVEMGSMGQQRTGRSGYSQVPTGPVDPAQSPYGNYGQSADYFGAGGIAPQPYNSDLGAQRLGPQGNQNYNSEFHNAPLSPAPTYATHDHVAALTAAGDRFGPGAISPSPEQYNNRAYTQTPPQPNGFAQTGQGNYVNRSYAPSVSTRYEPTEYHSQSTYVSPTQQSASQYGYGQDTGYDNTSQNRNSAGQYVRPPSMRKPVNGSLREI